MCLYDHMLSSSEPKELLTCVFFCKSFIDDHLNRTKIANNDPINEKIRREFSLIKFFKIHLLNSDLHDSSELPNVVNLDFFGKK